MIDKINPKYLPLYTTKKPIILITGGRGSAKSFNSSLFLKRLTYDDDQVILYSRYTMVSAEKSVIPEFLDKIEREGDHENFYITSKEINNLISGSRIIFSGIKTSSGNQTANLKGIEGLSTFVVDEGEEWQSEKEFDKIRLSIRKLGVQNRTIIIMNPSDVEHFIYKRFIKDTHRIVTIDGVDVEISTHPQVEHIHTTYLDNLPFLSKEFLAEVAEIKETDKNKYSEVIIGSWQRQKEGVLFKNTDFRYFTPSETLLKSFETSISYVDVADEGKDATAAPIGRNIASDIYITDVLFSKLNADLTIPLMDKKIRDNNVRVVRVESNNMGAMYKRTLEKIVPKTCALYGATATTNKHTRIIMDAQFIKKHCLFLEEKHQSEEYKAFMRELCNYMQDGSSKHDDAPDALQGLVMFIRSMFPKWYI
jgi:PBSX family phage terminase large subunit